MSDDALAALLLAYKYRNEEAAFTAGADQIHEAQWLRERGVVVLPPVAAEVLRTSEPNEAMCEEFERVQDMEHEALLGYGSRRAYTKIGLRAALAVLRQES